MLQGDVGPFAGQVHDNYSRYSATMQTLAMTYSLHSLFPGLCRSLLRRPSDALGATGVAVARAEAESETGQGDAAGQGGGDEAAPPSPSGDAGEFLTTWAARGM